MDQSSESENVQVKEGVVEEGRAVNSPRIRKETWARLRIEFEANTYTSLKELAKKHGVRYQGLKDKIWREKWNERKSTLQDQVLAKVDRIVLKEADKQGEYLARLNSRSEKYEEMLSASVSQMATNAQGVELVDPSTLDELTRSEIRVLEMRKTALRIVPLSQIDLTSGGRDLASSFIMAISKLRSDAASPRLQEEDLKRALEADIEGI